MGAQNLYRAVALLFFVPAALIAQVMHGEVPLKNWQAPLYWQQTQAESQALAAIPDATSNSNGVDDATSTSNLLVLVGITPCRVVDTRAGQGFTGAFGPPSLTGSASRTFPLQSSATCNIPSIAQAYSLNVTMVRRGPLGFIKLYPTGKVLPRATTLNATTGFIVENVAVAPAGTGGSVDAYASEPTDLILDINGYYAPVSRITPAQGASNEPALSLTGDEGQDILSPQTVTPSPDSNMSGADSIHNKSMTFNGLTNSITVDSVAPPPPGKPNELYIGGDNTGGPGGAIPFSKIKVGIGTKSVSAGKVTIFDAANPSLDIVGNLTGGGGARIELGVASRPGNFSNVASAGDVVVRADGSQTQDLILAARNGNQGAIRFTTGFAAACGGTGESQKMVLTNAGNLGIGPNFVTGQVCGGPATVSQRLDVDGRARIRTLPPGNTLTDVVVADNSGVLFTRNAITFPLGPTGPQGPAGPTGPQGPSGASSLVTVLNSATSTAGQGQLILQVPCPSGKKVVGGGYKVDPELNGNLAGPNEVRIQGSYPLSPSVWVVRSHAGQDQVGPWTLQVWAICE
jgi:hypothetical protein